MVAHENREQPLATVDLPEDEMTLEQTKQNLEWYRKEARRNPQIFLQKFIKLNNRICNDYEHSQRQIRAVAERARRELRRTPSPSPEPELPRKPKAPVDIIQTRAVQINTSIHGIRGKNII